MKISCLLIILLTFSIGFTGCDQSTTNQESSEVISAKRQKSPDDNLLSSVHNTDKKDLIIQDMKNRLVSLDEDNTETGTKTMIQARSGNEHQEAPGLEMSGNPDSVTASVVTGTYPESSTQRPGKEGETKHQSLFPKYPEQYKAEPFPKESNNTLKPVSENPEEPVSNNK